MAADVAVPHFRGSSTHVYEVARNLGLLGDEVHLVARRINSSQAKLEKVGGITIHRFQRGMVYSSKKSSYLDMKARGSYRGKTPPIVWKSYEAYLRSIFPIYIAVEVAKIVRDARIDVILERETSFGAGAIASMLTGRPFVLEVIGNRVTGLQLRRSSKVVAYSKEMFEGRVDASRIAVVTAAVDTEVFKPDPVAGAEVRNRYNLGDDHIVGYVGTFQEWHGLGELIEAAHSILGSLPNVKFLMVGPYFTETERKVKNAGLGNSFVFTGPVDYDRVSDYMNASDVLVAPYNPGKIRSSEQVRTHGLGSPLKVFEYMAVGKPVITTDVRPISDPIRNGITGYLVPPGNSVALGAAILGALQDKTRAALVGRAARDEAIEKYSWSIVAKQIRLTLLEALSSHMPHVTN